MKVIISDLSKEWNTALADSCDELFNADGRYAPCRAASAVGQSIRCCTTYCEWEFPLIEKNHLAKNIHGS